MESSGRRLIQNEYISLILSTLVIAWALISGHTSLNISSASVHLFLGIIFSSLISTFLIELKLSSVWRFRKNASNGIWLISLPSLSLFVGCHLNGVLFSHIRWLTMLISINLFAASFLFVLLLLSRNGYSNILFTTFLCFIPGSFFLPYYANIDFFNSLALNFCALLVFVGLIQYLLASFSSNFTLGEVILISQGITLFVLSSVYNLYDQLSSPNILSSISTQIILFVKLLLLACCLIVVFNSQFKFFRTPLPFLLLFLLVGFTFVYPLSHIIFNSEPLLWLISFIFNNNQRVSLLFSWFILLAFAIILVYAQSYFTNKPKTIIRKYFHFLIVSVFVPGLLYDYYFLFLSTSIIFSIFILLECARYFDVKPLSTVINQNFQFFFDEKDSGNLILSHFYLLIGCSLPIWIQPKEVNISSFAGLISIGIGDAVASIFGSSFGRHRWPGTSKTIEGSAASIVAQLLFSIFLESLNIYHCSSRLTLLSIILVTTLLEAFTTQIDNLVVPLLFYSLTTISL